MNPNWLVGITVVFVLLIAACGLWVNAASKTAEETIDFAVRVTCYDTGFQDGISDNDSRPPYDDSRCVDLYSDGYEDGRSGEYDPPDN